VAYAAEGYMAVRHWIAILDQDQEGHKSSVESEAAANMVLLQETAAYDIKGEMVGLMVVEGEVTIILVSCCYIYKMLHKLVLNLETIKTLIFNY
jgi:hypothetical protein